MTHVHHVDRRIHLAPLIWPALKIKDDYGFGQNKGLEFH